MADIAQLESALRRAHAAGDVNAAKRFAAEITNVRARNFSGSENPADDNFVKKLAHGANLAARKGLVGIENLLPDSAESYINKIYAENLDTKEKRLKNIKDGEAYTNVAGGFAKGGEMAAHVGAELLPALKVAKMLHRATSAFSTPARVATNITGNALTAGGVTAALSPEDKLENGATAAALSGAIEGTLGVTGKVIKGLAPGITAEARSLMDRGVNVPFWKATDSDFIRNGAERVKGFPMVGAAMRDQEAKTAAEYTAMKAREAMPDYLPSYTKDGAFKSWVSNPKSIQVDDKMLDNIVNQNDQVFDEIYRNRTIPLQGNGYDMPKDVAALLDEVKQTRPDIYELVKGRISGMHDPMVGATTLNSTPQFSSIVNQQGNPIMTGVNQSGGNAGISADTLKDTIARARKQAGDLYRSQQTESAGYLKEYAEMLQRMRLNGLPPDAGDVLPMANKAWQNMMVLENAMSKGGANRNGFINPRNISDSLRAMDNSPGKRKFAHNNMPGQRQVNDDNRVLGSWLPEVGPGTAEKMQAMMFAAGVPLASAGLMGADMGLTALLTTRTGNRMLMGATKPQIAASKWLEKNQPALSAILRSGASGSILNQE